MKLKTKLLIAGLNEVGRVLKSRTTHPAYSSVKISSPASGKARLECTSGDAWVSRTLECEGGIEPFMINHAKIVSLVSNSSSDAVVLSLTGSKLELKAGRIFKINALSGSEFPAAPSDSGKPVAVNLNDLADGINAVAWAANRDSNSKVIQQSVQIRMSAKEITCSATIGVRFALYRRLSICEERLLIIPAVSAAIAAETMRQKGAEVYASENIFRVSSESAEVSTKMPETGPWDDLKFLEMMGDASGTLLNGAWLAGICRDAITLTAADKSATVSITRDGDLLTARAFGGDEDGVELVRAPGQPLDLMLPAAQLLGVVSKLGETVKVVTLPNAAFLSSGDLVCGIAQMIRKAALN